MDKPSLNELKHIGILGMKWGKNRDGTSSKGSEDHIRAKALKAKGAKNLSTKELQDLNQRLQLEKQLKDLSPSKYKKGKAIAKGILATGTTLASIHALSKTPVYLDVTAAIAKKIVRI